MRAGPRPPPPRWPAPPSAFWPRPPGNLPRPDRSRAGSWPGSAGRGKTGAGARSPASSGHKPTPPPPSPPTGTGTSRGFGTLAILALMSDCLLRVSEATALQVDHLALEADGTARLTNRAQQDGPGGRGRGPVRGRSHRQPPAGLDDDPLGSSRVRCFAGSAAAG